MSEVNRRKDIGREREFAPEYIRQRLSYDPATGVFTWLYWEPKGVAWNAKHLNKRAGCRTRHYIKINIDKVPCLAHRLAWTYIHGAIPQHSRVDHINLNQTDNRIINLRLATQSENQQNWTRIRANGLPRGVHFYRPRGTWVARAVVRGKLHMFGYHRSPEQAERAYRSGMSRLVGEFAPWESPNA